MDDFIERAGYHIEAQAERRPNKRRRVLSPGYAVYDQGRGLLACSIRDLSATGARIAFSRNSMLPGNFYFIDIASHLIHEARVAWSSQYQAGLSFHRSFAVEQIVDPALDFLKQFWCERIAS